MTSILTKELLFTVGEEHFLDDLSPTNKTIAVIFEDDGDTGYFYAVNIENGIKILDTLHIYNVKNVVDKAQPSLAQIVWSRDGLNGALLINHYAHAVFNFDQCRGYCRSGFPPPSPNSTKYGHEWDDQALIPFK